MRNARVVRAGSLAACGFVLGGFLLCGCGKGTYEQRLEDSKQWFTRVNVLNEHLGPEVTVSGLTIRAPKSMGWMDPPKPPEPQLGPDGQPVEVKPEEVVQLPDPRQPTFINVELPGLQAAWKQGESYLYVMSNSGLKKTNELDATPGQEGKRREKFLEDVTKLLADVLNAQGFELSLFQPQQFPASKKTKFAVPVPYRVGSISCQDPGGTVFRSYGLYLYEEGNEDPKPIQIAILLVEPEGVADSVTTALGYSLQTLKVNAAGFHETTTVDASGAAGAAAGSGAGKPAGGGL